MEIEKSQRTQNKTIKIIYCFEKLKILGYLCETTKLMKIDETVLLHLIKVSIKLSYIIYTQNYCNQNLEYYYIQNY